jgi:hypothetical protein
MKAAGLVIPENDFTKTIPLPNGPTVQVRLRNGYLETGSREVNKFLPPMLRCIQGGCWINEATWKELEELHGYPPTDVVIFFWRKAQKTQEEKPSTPNKRVLRRVRADGNSIVCAEAALA